MLIDRLVSVRVCQDRGIEPWGMRRGLVDRAKRTGDDLYGVDRIPDQATTAQADPGRSTPAPRA